MAKQLKNNKSLVSEVKKSDNIKYKLKSIYVHDFSYKNPDKIVDTKDINVNYNISPEVKYNLVENIIIIKMNIVGNLIIINEDLLNITISFLFDAVDLNSYLETVGNISKFIDPRHEKLIPMLIGISLSTTRGIVYERLRGTLLDNRLIPIADPNMFYSP